MKIPFLFILTILIYSNQQSYARLSSSSNGQFDDSVSINQAIKNEVGEIYQLNDSTISQAVNQTIYADAIINDFKEKILKNEIDSQDLFIFVMGFHPKNCEVSLRTLGNLNQYKNLIPQIIKESHYNENLKWFQLILDHIIMPFPMRLNVSVEYPRTVKDYPFTFPDGMFKGLSGQINIRPIQNRCLYFLTAKWKGEKKLLSSLLELMSETLSKLGLEILFRKST